jgi:CheY-like chemotaxis protein
MKKNIDILLIDDDLTGRILLKKLFDFKQYSAEFAKDYVEALNVLDVVFPKVMIIDYTIPGMELKDFLEQIKNMDELNNVLKIVFTARDLTPEEKKNYFDEYQCMALHKIEEQNLLFGLIATKLKSSL